MKSNAELKIYNSFYSFIIKSFEERKKEAESYKKRWERKTNPIIPPKENERHSLYFKKIKVNEGKKVERNTNKKNKYQTNINLVFKKTKEKKFRPGIRVYNKRTQTPDVYEERRRRGMKKIPLSYKSHLKEILENKTLENEDNNFDIRIERPHIKQSVRNNYLIFF